MRIIFLLFFTVSIQFSAFSQSPKQLYKKFKAEGENYFSQGDYVSAIASFEQALKNKTGDKFSTQRLAECNKIVKEKYAELIVAADRLYKSGDLQAASGKYKEALNFKPEDSYAKNQVDACSIAPGSTYFKAFGNKSYDEAQTVLALDDGSIIMAGRASPSSSTNTDISLVKLDRDGNQEWEKKFGDDETEEANDLIKTRDGNFMVVGFSDSYSGSPGIKDMWVIKFDAAGNEIWNKTYGTDVTIDEGNSIVEAHDDGYLIVGNSFVNGSLNIMAIKIAENGEKVWEKIYGGQNSEEGTKVVKTGDGYTIVGNTESKGKGKWDIWLLHLDKEGNELWDQTYGGGDNETANAIVKTSDGGYLIAGSTYSFAFASQDFWIIKTDAQGKEIWNKAIGSYAAEEAFGLIETKDGKFVAVGFQEVWDEAEQAVSLDGYDVYIVKIDEKGEVIWDRAVGGEKDQRGFDLAELEDGSLMVVGFTKADMKKGVDYLVMKMNKLGLVSKPTE
ncbi:hypothetical protein [Flexithrix dorotheae]|uniref:hypothetical protein n=1 Tax=Flexithrix dorotheae TaxID=70993 RepID=UPI0012F8AC52|nr:hypothetical protein [Flexithrix dorotheae]